jgi:DNA-binding NarL/FixJ family response regulator
MISSGIVCREFIGRTIELDFLVERASRVDNSRGVSMLIKGAAGIGKTRLIREFIDACSKNGLPAYTALCSAFGDEPYAPILSLAAQLNIEIVASTLRADDDISNVRHERMRRFNETISAFGTIARLRGPFVLVLEDLHWADPASLELLHHLMAALKQAPVVLIASERGDDAVNDVITNRLLESIERDADATLTLGPLTSDELRSLIASAMRDDGRRLSAVVIDEISSLSDGRPFHAEELLRNVLDRDPQRASDVASIPRSLRAAVTERLNDFSADDRIALAHAAVIGRRFSLALLTELLSLDEQTLLPILRRARNAQLIQEEGTDVFSFRHALTREVVYEEILRSEARRLHLRLAQTLIKRSPEKEATSIAYHAWCSGDTVLTESWNTRCGERFAAMCAHVDAIKHFDRAYSAAESSDKRAALASRIASAYYAVGELNGATAWYERAAADAASGTDPDATYRHGLERARVLFEGGSYEAGIGIAGDLASTLRDRGDALYFQAETLCAGLLGAVGRAQEAMQCLERASQLSCEPEPTWVARHHGISAQNLHALGRVEESALAFDRAETAARNLGDRELLIRTLYNASNLKMSCGDISEALADLEAGLVVAREVASLRLVAWLLENIALCHILLGNLDACATAHDEAIHIDHGIPSVRIWLGAIGIRLGTLRGDDRLIKRMGGDELLLEALESGSDFDIGPIAGAVLLWRQATGQHDYDLAERAVTRLSTLRAVEWDVTWFALAAARLTPSLAARARSCVEEASRPAYTRGARACLTLLDARLAQRDRRRDDADALFRKAIQQFKLLRWPIEEAVSREFSGSIKDAVEIFRRVGAHAEVTRLTSTNDRVPRRRGESTLTRREREIAAQIVRGKTNRQVADALFISERTVETHVASIYGKLGVANRKDLAALLSPGG